jgi:hypothetical protein
MRKIFIPLLLVIIFIQNIKCQEIKSPSEFLGYELGTQFTFHTRAVDYFRYVS